MIHKILSIFLLTPALMQIVDSIKPDISYTGDNDRFDMSAMIRANNKMYRDTPSIDDGEDYRRQLRNEDTDIPHLSDDLKKKPPAIIFLTRRADDDTPYDPDEVRAIGRAGTYHMMDMEFEENLKQFMNLPKASRRKRKETV